MEIRTNNYFLLQPFTFDCNHHIERVTLSGIECIYQNTFQYCSNLRRVDIPSTVTKICDFAFDSCSSLTHLVIPENVESLGMQTFHQCISLPEIHIPSKVTTIPRLCFAFCKRLTKITYSSEMASFDDGAFTFCLSLKHIDIPSTLTSIGACCFLGSSKLHSISKRLKETLIEVGEDALFYDLKENELKKDVDKNGKPEYYCDNWKQQGFGSIENEIYRTKKIIQKKEVSLLDSK